MFMTDNHTANGRINQPLSVESLNYRAAMKIDSKKVLWENVTALMVDLYKKENLTRLAKESGVGPGTMTRIKEQETSVGVDVLEKLAAVAKVEPWQLLTPGMGKSDGFQTYKENHPLAPVQQAQVAINNAALVDALATLQDALHRADPLDRSSCKPYLVAMIDDPERVDLVHRIVCALDPPAHKATPEIGAHRRAA